MSFLKGKQIATGSDGVATANLIDNILSANVSGRAKIQTGYFDFTTVSSDFTTSSIALSKLEEEVIQADGGQAFTNNQSMGGYNLTNLATPIVGTDAANKNYVDSVAMGLDWKNSARVATTASLPSHTFNSVVGAGASLTSSVNQTIGNLDGTITLAVNDRILVKDESSDEQNGIYSVIATGSLSDPWILARSSDSDSDSDVTAGLAVFVEEGTMSADTGWVLVTDNPISLNVTSLSFSKFSSTGGTVAGAGLTSTGSTLDVGAGPGILVTPDTVEVAYYSGSVSDIEAGVASSLGTSQSASRGDHIHSILTDAAVGLGNLNSEGTSNALARADHVHQRDISRQVFVDITSSVATDQPLPSFAFTPVTSSGVIVYLNGLMQRQGSGNDYTISGATITWLAGSGTAVDLATNDELLVSFLSET